MANSTVPLKTGLIYNVESEKHLCKWDPLHAEGPYRTKSIMRRLEEPEDNLVKQCQRLPGRAATYTELKMIHSPALIEHVNRTCVDPGPNDVHLKAFSERYNDVFLCEATEECALDAAGSTISLVAHVWHGKVKNGLAVVRPPGHHASPEESNGFCVYNNVALGAKYLLEEKKAKRILIVDWDVHHGQGTQRAFISDKRVLYFSIHRYEQGDFWPNLKESNFNHIGEGEGRGYNINVPLNKTGLGDAEYLAIFHQVLLPVAYEFNPELVIVSAGYDAAMGCPEGRMKVSPAMYGHLTQALCCLAGGKVAVVLEGGYCADSLSEGVACTLEALLGRPAIPLPPMTQPDQTLKFHTPEVIFRGPTEPPANEAYGATEFYTASQRVDWRHAIAALRAGYDKFRYLRKSLMTSYGYSEEMKYHVRSGAGPVDDLIWDTPNRLVWIFEHLKRCGLLGQCLPVKVVPADAKCFSLIHSPNYSMLMGNATGEAFVETVKYHTDPNTNMEDRWAPDLFASQGTPSAIQHAVGCLQCVADAVLSGEALNGFAIVRPPGHHAQADHPAGFCFVNNVGIVAKNLLERDGLKRVLIVDFDVHHGDGVQEAFYEDPRVLYISIHRGNNGSLAKENDFYPYGPGKAAKFTGKGAGLGFNVNLPWALPGKNDGDYIHAFLQLVMPVAYEFAPEMTLVCCGFDAAAGDKGSCQVSPTGFYQMTRMLKSLAGGRLVLTLEGGYKKEALELCSEAVMRALMDLPLSNAALDGLIPSDSAIQDIKSALDVQKAHWKALQYRVVFSHSGGSGGPGQPVTYRKKRGGGSKRGKSGDRFKKAK